MAELAPIPKGQRGDRDGRETRRPQQTAHDVPVSHIGLYCQRELIIPQKRRLKIPSSAGPKLLTSTR
jgi:hypothetical protein